MEKPRVFLCLDALRGTAAIVILLFHVPYFFGAVLFQHGYIAVDFFFMLSGFVLSFAYQEKIDQGGFFLRFAKIQMVRLYPLYFLGLVLGLMQLLFSANYAPGVNSPRLAASVVLC